MVERRCKLWNRVAPILPFRISFASSISFFVIVTEKTNFVKSSEQSGRRDAGSSEFDDRESGRCEDEAVYLVAVGEASRRADRKILRANARVRVDLRATPTFSGPWRSGLSRGLIVSASSLLVRAPVR